MTKTYYPFDAGAGADVTEAQWGAFAGVWRGTGVLAGKLNQLEVYGDSSGMQVKVKSGQAWIEGFFFKSDAEESVSIDAADGTHPRWDVVVVEVDWSNNDIDLVAVKGSAGASPTKPALSQSSSIWQIPLAWVYVPAGASVITVNDVFDARVYDYDDILGDGRLSLVKGVKNINMEDEVKGEAPTSTDTGADTVTYTTLPVWAVEGQSVQVSANGGGLSTATEYFIHISGSSFSFHTCERDALAVANKVNLTASITATIYPGRIYFVGGKAAEFSVSIVGLAASSAFEIYLDESAMRPTLTTLVWTDVNTRATDIDLRADGRWALTSSDQYVSVGSFETSSTAGEVMWTPSRRKLWNNYNPVDVLLRAQDPTTGGWAYSVAAWRLLRTGSANEYNTIEIFAGLPVKVELDMDIRVAMAGGEFLKTAISLDDASNPPTGHQYEGYDYDGTATGYYGTQESHFAGGVGVGRHYLALMEYGHATGVSLYGGVYHLAKGGYRG